MPEPLTLSDFDVHLNARFPVHLGPGAILEMELIEATPLPEPGRGNPVMTRPPFSLIFRGPLDRLLPQHLYQMDHPSRGMIEIFLVPLGPEGDPTGHHYQALFN
jgi:hypothetical protein